MIGGGFWGWNERWVGESSAHRGIEEEMIEPCEGRVVTVVRPSKQLVKQRDVNKPQFMDGVVEDISKPSVNAPPAIVTRTPG